MLPPKLGFPPREGSVPGKADTTAVCEAGRKAGPTNVVGVMTAELAAPPPQVEASVCETAVPDEVAAGAGILELFGTEPVPWARLSKLV